MTITGDGIELSAWALLALNLLGGILLGVAVGLMMAERRRR